MIDKSQLKSDFEQWKQDKKDEIISNKEEDLKKFRDLFLNDNLNSLTLDNYTNTLSRKSDYFLYLLEAGTRVGLGSAKPGSMKGVGLWLSKDELKYAFKDPDNLISENEANKIFNEQILPFWKKVVELSKNKHYSEILHAKPTFFSAYQFILKLVYVINPQDFLGIYNEKKLDRLANMYSIPLDSSDDYIVKANKIAIYFRDLLKEDTHVIGVYLWIKHFKNEFDELYEDLNRFIVQSDNADDATSSSYNRFYKNKFKIKAGFGSGNFASVTHIGFLKDNNKINNGYFPVFLYDRLETKKLYLSFGLSITESSKENWPTHVLNQYKPFSQLPCGNVSTKYAESLYYKEYEVVDGELQAERDTMEEDLNEILKIYSDEPSTHEPTVNTRQTKVDELITNVPDVKNILLKKKQIILYGPAGTGKTYNTKNIIHNFLEKKSLLETNHKTGVDTTYASLKNMDRVEFVTFHQSFAYEEFVEGLRPSTDPEGNIKYEIKSGLFKKLCERAISGIVQTKTVVDFNRHFFKISLGNTLTKSENNIYNYCMDNGCISLGWGRDVDYSSAKSKQDIQNLFEKKYGKINVIKGNNSDEDSPYNITAMNFLILNMKKGDYVLVSKGNKKLAAIGIVEGDYEYDNTSEIKYHQFRSVKWLVKDLEIPVEQVLQKNFSQQSIYEMYNADLKQEAILKLLEDPTIGTDYSQTIKMFYNLSRLERNERLRNIKPYFLVIDEINRGNISKILGELITLLESDKRLGEENELIVKLPYSQEQFGVPPNLYIIGTMNTSDRSIANLDIALRRRFGFVEMNPNYSLLEGRIIEGINIKELLKNLNNKIQSILDKDHLIGHSFLLSVSTIEDLKQVWEYEIIPLLEEYFYGNIEKMKEILPKDFIEEISDDNCETTSFTIKKLDSEEFISALKKLN